MQPAALTRGSAMRVLSLSSMKLGRRRMSRISQAHMNEVHQRVAKEIDAFLAPVGEEWWSYKKSWPNLKMYDEDGAHASPAGSDFAAKMIWEEIRHDLQRRKKGKIS